MNCWKEVTPIKLSNSTLVTFEFLFPFPRHLHTDQFPRPFMMGFDHNLKLISLSLLTHGRQNYNLFFCFFYKLVNPSFSLGQGTNPCHPTVDGFERCDQKRWKRSATQKSGADNAKRDEWWPSQVIYNCRYLPSSKVWVDNCSNLRCDKMATSQLMTKFSGSKATDCFMWSHLFPLVTSENKKKSKIKI